MLLVDSKELNELVGMSVKVSLIVSNSRGFTSDTSVVLHVSEANVPTISILTPQMKVNLNSKFSMTGVVTQTSGFRLRLLWGSNRFNMSSVAMSPFESRTEASHFKFDISILVDSLEFAPSSTYTFSLSAFSESSVKSISYSTVQIEINFPPVDGVFIVNPNKGTSLQTMFYFKTYGWMMILQIILCITESATCLLRALSMIYRLIRLQHQ
jgi:hypothetical protein